MKIKKYLLLFIIPILVIVISRSFSLTYTHEIRSIEIQSLDYNNPGSWHIDKSAEWTGLGKAKVTFDVKSVMKTANGRYKDVILVMDISGSMNGEKLDRAKQDAIDLTNYLLSNSNNRVALITFDSTSQVLSGFTNNLSNMLSYLNNLTDRGSTNYNAGLSSINYVMEDYVRDENKDLVVLFLTDGYPNEDTPNQTATYGMLKDKYPYMTINGIQYEMGKDVIQEIIDISDNQYIANMDTLNNVLFEATIVPMYYEKFIITDYIYDDYFYIESASDVEVPFGNVAIENEGSTQKVIWDLGNNYVTGRNVKMYINLKLKEEYHNTKGLYPTNTNEIIISKIPEEVEKRTDSELTPVLQNSYNIIYETNTPDGCNLPTIPSEEYFVYQKVTKRNDVLTCPGYIFKGWYIKSSDIANITLINEDTFIMPARDVTIRGTWTKQDMAKTMDGTVKVKLNGTLRQHDRDTAKTFGKSISRESFESITTVDDVIVPSTAIDFWDVSAERNGSVLAWYTDTDNDGKYELFLGQEDGVKANSNSNYTFFEFRNVEMIDLSHFDISNVTNMNAMFAGAGFYSSSFNIIDLSNWDVSKVKTMNSMFNNTGRNSTSLYLDLSNWDVSNVTNMSYMFYGMGNESETLSLGNINNWDTSKVTNMTYMFYGMGFSVRTFNLDLSNWDTSKVTNMSYMFYSAGYNASTFNLDISTWDTSKVTNMEYMFYCAGHTVSNFNINLSNWNTSSVTNMNHMFNNAGYNASTWTTGDLRNWDTSSVTNMLSMFNNAGRNATTWNVGDLSNWDTSSVINMNGMFVNAGYSATTWNIGDLRNWDTSSVTNMSQMFDYTGYSATTWNIGDLSNWDTSSVTNMSQMFDYTGYSATTFDIGDISNWDVSKVKDTSHMFSDAGYSATLFNIGDLSNWDTSQVTNMTRMFYHAGHDSRIFNLNLSRWDVSKVTSMASMFVDAGNHATTWSIGDLSNWDTSNVTNMSDMFRGAGSNITIFDIGDLSNWDTSKVTNMYFMFGYVGQNSTKVDISYISNWNVSNVKDMSYMFEFAGYHASELNLGDLSNWDTSSVTNMLAMFYGAGANATTWNSIGTLKVYANNVSRIFLSSNRATATLDIYSNPTSYDLAFTYAAIKEGSGITVNYSSATTNIDDIIATKSSDSNVVKGVQLD